MNLPNFIDRKALKARASEGETHAVRLILRRVTSTVPYTLRCRARSYIFERNLKLSAHILDIPLSIWMDQSTAARGVPALCDDLRSTDAMPLSFHVVPWGESTVAESQESETKQDLADALDLVEKLIASLAVSHNTARFERVSHSFPEAESAMMREGQSEADRLLRKHGRERMADFQQAMWPGDIDVNEKPNGETKAPKPVAKQLPAKKVAKKAAKKKAQPVEA